MPKCKIPIAVRTAVWNRYIGEPFGQGKCFTGCGTTITQATFQCGHVIAEKNGGSITIDNLRPICQRCNSSMRTRNMFEFIDTYKLKSTSMYPNLNKLIPMDIEPSLYPKI